MAAQVVKTVQPVVATHYKNAFAGNVDDAIRPALLRRTANVDPFAREDPLALASIKVRGEIARAIEGALQRHSVTAARLSGSRGRRYIRTLP